jgi:hypothetical protein
MRVAVNAPSVTLMGHEVRESHTKKRALRHKNVKKIDITELCNIQTRLKLCIALHKYSHNFVR